MCVDRALREERVLGGEGALSAGMNQEKNSQGFGSASRIESLVLDGRAEVELLFKTDVRLRTQDDILKISTSRLFERRIQCNISLSGPGGQIGVAKSGLHDGGHPSLCYDGEANTTGIRRWVLQRPFANQYQLPMASYEIRVLRAFRFGEDPVEIPSPDDRNQNRKNVASQPRGKRRALFRVNLSHMFVQAVLTNIPHFTPVLRSGGESVIGL